MRKTSLKDYMQEFLTKEEFDLAPRSFEVVGDIAIIEVPEELISKEKQIGESVLKVNSSIKTVLKKSGIHGGEFRTQNLEFVAGENKKETEYVENGIKLKLNPEIVYFSAKLSTERETLMGKLAPENRILTMFSGCGPYSLVALKKQPNLARVDSIELNPEGHKYALENLSLNKNLLKKSEFYKNLIEFLRENKLPVKEKELISNLNKLRIHFICADVKSEVKKFKLENRNDYVESSDNFMFELEPAKAFEKLKNLPENSRLYIEKESISNPIPYAYFLVMFAEKFEYVLYDKNENTYRFFDDFNKGYLLNFFEGISIENLTRYDEIYMPLPKDAWQFLDSAFEVVAKNGIIHMYDFLDEEEIETGSKKKVLDVAKKLNRKVEIIETRKVGQYSPRKYRVCCDFKVLD
ncbi:MAG: class I SAM-dependent methyltransferase [Nanoarchaeota archaeon]